jgi:hypothetical protein
MFKFLNPGFCWVQLRHLFTALVFLFPPSVSLYSQPSDKNYLDYHQEILRIENLLVERNWNAALELYVDLSDQYDFIFLRDLKLASQVALFAGQPNKSQYFLEKAVEGGWSKNQILSNPVLNHFFKRSELISVYREARTERRPLDEKLSSQVRKMSFKDQRMAFGALLYIGDAAQARYAEREFGPHSIRQMELLWEMLEKPEYPGERLVGNPEWMSTIISHHNSISQGFNRADKIYPRVFPKLMDAVERGELYPYQLAIIDDWYRSSVEKDALTYGYLNTVYASHREACDELRASLGLRSIELHNALVDLQEETKLDLYFEAYGWLNGKIQVQDD